MSQPIVSANPTQPSPPIRLPYPGYRVARATTREELIALARRRYQVFVEKMAALPTHPTFLEVDAFDLHAEHFYASVDGVVVGCMRVVKDGGGGFPMEEHGTQLPEAVERSTCAECSRVNASAVDGHDICHDLIVAAVAWGCRQGLKHFVAISNDYALSTLQRQGWPYLQCGPAIEHAGLAYYPALLPLAEASLIE